MVLNPNNRGDIESPDSLEVRSAPPMGLRVSRRAGIVVTALLGVAGGAIAYNVATRAPPPAGSESAESAPDGTVESGREAASKVLAGIPDTPVLPQDEFEVRPGENPYLADMPQGQAFATADPTLAPTLSQTQQPMQANMAPPPPPQPTPEEMAAMERENRFMQERQTAIDAESGAQNFGQNIGAPDPAAALTAGMQAAAGGMTGRGGGDDLNQQGAKEAFLSQLRDRKLETPYLMAERTALLTPYEIKTGTIIPAVMIDGINSDLPGEIIGQVRENVFDTASGQHLLVPQGSRLFGMYDSRVSYGQKRVLIGWSRLIFPDGSTLELGGMGGFDQAGTSGFNDRVDNHYGRIFGFALLTSLFSAGVQLSQPNDGNNNNGPSARQTASAALGQEVGQVGAQITRRNLDVQPTLRIRPGYKFVVKVNRDIVFQAPYSPMRPVASKSARNWGG